MNKFFCIIVCLFTASLIYLEIRCDLIDQHVKEAAQERDIAIRRANVLQRHVDYLQANNIALNAKISNLQNQLKSRSCNVLSR